MRIPWMEGMLYPYKENPYKVSTVDMIEKMFESFPSPRVFKSHLRYHLIPKAADKTGKPRYIYVMRNPKDTAVSFYHHSHFFSFLKDPSSWETYFDQFIKGEGKQLFPTFICWLNCSPYIQNSYDEVLFICCLEIKELLFFFLKNASVFLNPLHVPDH